MGRLLRLFEPHAEGTVPLTVEIVQNLSAGFNAIHNRHLYVENDRVIVVGLVLLNLVEGLLPVFGNVNLAEMAGQSLLERL